MTATSTTKSVSGHTHGGKKPFFQRLFGKFSSSLSSLDLSINGGSISRRHSVIVASQPVSCRSSRSSLIDRELSTNRSRKRRGDNQSNKTERNKKAAYLSLSIIRTFLICCLSLIDGLLIAVYR